jgi:predicted TIM-barrel fold metal-dependent hydrolase
MDGDRQVTGAEQLQGRVLMISSDGHVAAKMEDYRSYMPSKHHQEFDEFCARRRSDPNASRTTTRASMLTKYDEEVVDMWTTNVIDQGRLEGTWDIKARFDEMARSGLAAEVLFPDFGLPFELYGPFQGVQLGYRRTAEQIDIANRAYNRWLADFISEAPHRFAALAAVSFDDVDAAIAEIVWAKEAGFRGVLLPIFSENRPLFHTDFDRIWATVSELEMPVNSHVTLSSATEYLPNFPPMENAAVGRPIYNIPLYFFCQQILNHFIWSGVLDRHPNLQIVFTEQGSAWIVGALQAMDYTWEGSLLKRDFRDVVKHKPSDYFERQCHIGSSIFSRAEVEARHAIGVHKMTLGVDYPHPEGTWGMGPGHLEYLRATLGVAGVPADEARLLLGENALDLWHFDRSELQAVADVIGHSLADVLTVPEKDEFPRGDVHKPLGGVTAAG